MTSSPGDAPGGPRFRLITLGTLQLAGGSESGFAGEKGHQRRRLALLSVLAAAGDRGKSRDQLMGLFWSDATQARARHSLEQLLYAIRTSLDGAVFTGVNPVALNPAFITSDVSEFTSALASGDRETAVGLYGGPFLDGFYLPDAPEFEQWVDAQRARLHGSYTAALEELVKAAASAGDRAARVRWSQKLVDADTVSATYAAGLIRALTHAGDHAAALKFAERYEALVRQELGTSVGPALAALVEEVRERSKSGSVVVRGDPPSLLAGGQRKPRRAGNDETPAPAADQVEDLDVPATSDSIPVQKARGATGRLYGVAAGVALAVGAGALLVSVRGDAPTSADRPSLAVLPLANVGGEQSDAAVVDGLSEELIGVLARIDNLRVVARTSAFAFRNTTLDSRQIGDSLGVSHLLEGGVQRVGDSLRIQVRLIDASDGSTKWSERYDRGAQDVFLVQSEIAAAVARQLDLQLRPRAGGRNRRAPTTSVAAHELYLRASDPANLRSDTGVRSARELFRRAIELDSNYAAAYAGLARMEMRVGGGVLSSNPNAGYEARALAAASKAIALDESSPDAHAALGLIRMAQYDFIAAERELKAAIALDPSASRTREWLAFVYFWLDRREEALESTTRAVENDPLSPSAHAERARALCIIGRHDEGIAVLAKLKDIRPQLLRVPFFTTLCHVLKRDWPQVIARTRPESDPLSRALLGYALARTGHRDDAARILRDLTETREQSGRGSFEIAVLQTGLLDRDAAVGSLERALNEKVVRSNVALALFEDLHGHAGYEKIRARLGIQKR